ncbi:MAG: glycosyltransferase family protein [Myxococcales bacterium]|nr:glycosyltransferase family protein [Myxococcales bacterium]
MRTVAIIQARMGSSRLPGKVLCDLGGASMLSRVVERLRYTRRIDDIVVATSCNTADDAVIEAAERLNVGWHRGSEHDVLGRFLGAARAYDATAIVRVTADCPLLDARVVDQVVNALTVEVDYASNTLDRRFPRGLDVEALHRDTLERIDRLGTSKPAREHVTAFVMEAPALFRVAHVRADRDDSDLRWTVDTEDDLAMVRRLYDELGLATPRPYREVVDAVRARPELAAGNAHVTQKPWQVPHVS